MRSNPDGECMRASFLRCRNYNEELNKNNGGGEKLADVQQIITYVKANSRELIYLFSIVNPCTLCGACYKSYRPI